MILPLAHLGHFLWIFYVMPVVIVIVGILRSTMVEKRKERDDPTAPGAEGGPRTDKPARPQDPPP
jgi:hypothetical protein